MASTQEVFTAAQVGSILEDDTELVFSGSDDDFDALLDEDLDPLEREQGNFGTYAIPMLFNSHCQAPAVESDSAQLPRQFK